MLKAIGVFGRFVLLIYCLIDLTYIIFHSYLAIQENTAIKCGMFIITSIDAWSNSLMIIYPLHALVTIKYKK